MRSLLRLLLLLFLFYMVVSLTRSAIYLSGKGKILDDARQKLSQAQEKNAELKKKLEEVQSQEFIEKEAREKLDMSYDGESVVMFVRRGKADETPCRDARSCVSTSSASSPDPSPNWLKWWRLIWE